jgi:hypothetical protein
MNRKNQTNLPEWDKFKHLSTRQEAPARAILLQEGQISKKSFYIEKRCLRIWFNNETKKFHFYRHGAHEKINFFALPFYKKPHLCECKDKL